MKTSVGIFRKRLPIPTLAVMALGLILTGVGFSDIASNLWIGASGLLLVGLVLAKESILWRWRHEQLREELAGQRERAEQALAAERKQAEQALTTALAAERKRKADSSPNVEDCDKRIRIDALDLVKQLSRNDLKHSLIRFFEMNHRWIAMLEERNRRTAAATYDFIDREMPDALFCLDQFRVIESKRQQISGGYVLDLGVYKGGSTRRLARIFPERTIHGFDSFEGLPEDWSYTLAGTFGDVRGALPDVPDNVVLHKGWFDDTLPVWKEAHCDLPVSILRIDCDIYSSTKTVFDVLGDRLEPGSWLVFDELIGYRGWEKHEYRAFKEFIEKTGFDYSYVAYGLTHVVVRLGAA